MSPGTALSRLGLRYRRFRCAHFGRRPVTLRRDEPTVSFCFDDFPRSAWETGGAILAEAGFTGTYYTALGLAGQVGPVGPYFSEDLLPAVIAGGHELGCHTFDHLHAWSTAATVYERSVARNRERLAQLLPGAAFDSHSYPISRAHPRNKAVIGRHFACARGGEPAPNGSEADANSLNAVFIEKAGGDQAALRRVVDQAIAARGWLILATHDLGDRPSPFGCTPRTFADLVGYVRAQRVAVLPVARALQHLKAP